MNGVFDDLYETARECRSPIVQDRANRGRSWDQCCTFFQEYRNWDEEQRQANRELACLHLGFYLASWGMFRGSGPLMQKDYTIDGGIVDLLFADAYNELWEATFFQGLLTREDALLPNNGQIRLIFDLAANIRNYVNGLTIIRGPGQPQENAKCSDTIVTKILLGTLACTPAYDKYFPKGLTACGIEECGYFRQDCFTSLLNVCKEHRLWEVLTGRPIEYYAVVYPIMRVVDMYFWFKGRANN